MARNLPAQIVSDFGGRIISGAIPPGSILTSDKLEAQLGVSRVVVHEAPKVLHDKRLTRARTKIGTIVLQPFDDGPETKALISGPWSP